MMDLAINGGSMKITDDNKTIVSKDIAEQIEQNVEVSDDNKKPELTIKDW